MLLMSISHHLLRFQTRIETIAENHSVPGRTGLSLDDTFAALDLVGRRHVQMLLEMVKAFSDDDNEKAAAEHLRLRADRVWHGSSLSRSTAEDRASRHS